MRDGWLTVFKFARFLLVINISALTSALFLSLICDLRVVENQIVVEILLRLVLFSAVLTAVISVIFIETGKKLPSRLISAFMIIAFAVLLSIFLIVKSGLAEKLKSIEDLRLFISSFGAYSGIIYVLIQFLQVAVIPLPSFLTVGAGVLLFGPFKAAVLGVTGIISGSVFAFFMGRKFGVKAVSLLIGKNNLEKGLKFTDGKDEILLTFAFLFPFFPDDVLCFVSGLTKINAVYFVFMIIVVRLITVFAACYSLNNNLIPYDTWWGIALWIVFFIFTVVAAVTIYKYGDKIESRIKRKFFKKS